MHELLILVSLKVAPILQLQECNTHAHGMQKLTFSSLPKGVPSKDQLLERVSQTCLVPMNLSQSDWKGEMKHNPPSLHSYPNPSFPLLVPTRQCKGSTKEPEILLFITAHQKGSLTPKEFTLHSALGKAKSSRVKESCSVKRSCYLKKCCLYSLNSFCSSYR